jgi:hypothetical protein
VIWGYCKCLFWRKFSRFNPLFICPIVLTAGIVYHMFLSDFVFLFEILN